LDWISEYIILNLRISIGHGVNEKLSEWIRNAKFPYPYTTASLPDSEIITVTIPQVRKCGLAQSESCI